VYATGTVEAEDRVRVKAKIGGSVAELYVREGATVKRGDRLARIDNPAARWDLERGKVELAAATERSSPQLEALGKRAQSIEADLKQAEQDLPRLLELARQGALASVELEKAQARVTALQATLAAARAEQAAARIDLSSTTSRQAVQLHSLSARLEDTLVTSPLDGVVLARRVELGEVVAVNQDLFTVGDTRRLILEVSVDEADVARISTGDDERPASTAAVSLYAFADRVFEARLFELLPDANRERKAFLAKLRLVTPPPGLRSGMTAEVNLIADERLDALLVPTSALDAGKLWVVRDDRAHQIAVQLGITDLLRSEVTSGLETGELVVLEGSTALREGARVDTTLRDLPLSAALPDTGRSVQNSL
jgi:multidrug efflux pump subunit AcrA (membrane-fusion protein)